MFYFTFGQNSVKFTAKETKPMLCHHFKTVIAITNSGNNNNREVKILS